MNNTTIKKLKNWIKFEIDPKKLNSEKIAIPRKAGLYMLYTNTPIAVFNSLKTISIKGVVDIGLRSQKSLKIDSSLLIKENIEENYCVYIGHHNSLNQRLKEHFLGSIGTGCLSLFKHKKLVNYKWIFYYFETAKLKNNLDSNLLRTILENNLKSHFGWPILCAR